MKIFWTTLNPRLRALTVFIAGTLLAMLGFLATGALEPVNILFSFYFSGLLVYFLVRWGVFAVRVSIVLPNQEIPVYEKLRKNPGRRRHGPTSEAEFIDADEADEELLPDDRVIGIFHNGEAAAYPLAALAATIVARKGADPDSSWTAKLLAKGPEKCAEKFGEEAIEAIIEAVKGDRAGLTAEAADVLYHLLVMLAARDVTLDDVLAELARRQGQSGLAEKAARKG